MDGIELFAHWRQLKNKVTSYCDRLQVATVARTGHLYLDAAWRKLLARSDADPSPIMLCYMSDGWSAFVWQVKKTWIGEKSVQVWTREKQEFLLQRGILKKASPTGVEAAMLFKAPRPLLHGKNAWNMFRYCTGFHAPLRDFSHGPTILFCAFDGLHLAPLKRMIEARRRLYYECLAISAEHETETSSPMIRNEDQ